MRAGWYALALVLSLGIVALVLYSTGTFDQWSDDRSLDQACDGTLSQDGLDAALRSSSLSADSEGDGDHLAACRVRNAKTGAQAGAVELTLRWSSATPSSGELSWYNKDYNGVRAQAVPLGNGWSGIARRQGAWQVMVALDCVNEKKKALVAYGDLTGTANNATLTGLARVTTETAQNAAEKHGCQVKPGKRLTEVSTSRLGTPDTATPLDQAQGSCTALRKLAPTAARNGAPEAMEYPADAHTPQVNCYLATPDKKPGYGLYAYYGAAAEDFLASEGDNLKKGYGPTHSDKDYSWATAQCPQSTQPAVFVLYHLLDGDTDTYPIAHHSAEFATSALSTFAGHEAQVRGCADVHMGSVP
ncbi:hypothetical protein [Streptomyces sp. NPDC050264]|uniref:hypothetical protein n=1 Tax=Streptomyces sp. NPDC050264 TaxID=3155038 RepID=UPI0034133394